MAATASSMRARVIAFEYSLVIDWAARSASVVSRAARAGSAADIARAVRARTTAAKVVGDRLGDVLGAARVGGGDRLCDEGQGRCLANLVADRLGDAYGIAGEAGGADGGIDGNRPRDAGQGYCLPAFVAD